MSSESRKRCSVEELKERNLPPERHPSAEEWDNLLTILSTLCRLTAAQSDGMTNPSCPAMKGLRAQTEALVRETAAIRQLLERREQDGKQKERWRLPPVTLPKPRLAWLWVIPILLGLWVMWYSLDALWNGINLLIT